MLKKKDNSSIETIWIDCIFWIISNASIFFLNNYRLDTNKLLTEYFYENKILLFKSLFLKKSKLNIVKVIEKSNNRKILKFNFFEN